MALGNHILLYVYDFYIYDDQFCGIITKNDKILKKFYGGLQSSGGQNNE